MENHFHLVITTPEGNLSQWMHRQKTALHIGGPGGAGEGGGSFARDLKVRLIGREMSRGKRSSTDTRSVSCPGMSLCSGERTPSKDVFFGRKDFLPVEPQGGLSFLFRLSEPRFA
jgi:hypothetical protein